MSRSEIAERRRALAHALHAGATVERRAQQLREQAEACRQRLEDLDARLSRLRAFTPLRDQLHALDHAVMELVDQLPAPASRSARTQMSTSGTRKRSSM